MTTAFKTALCTSSRAYRSAIAASSRISFMKLSVVVGCAFARPAYRAESFARFEGEAA